MLDKSNPIERRMQITTLAWPILVEILLRTAISTSDVFMLSGYSDLAVSAIGVISQIIFFLMIISMMVSTGTGILIGQYNGSGRTQQSTDVAVASVVLGGILGLGLSLFAFFAANPIVIMYGLESDVATFAYDYLIITGSFTLTVTLGIVFSTILRSNGYSRTPMIVNLLTGGLNIFGNYCALYQPFGLPVYGVQGVAVATAFSQVINTIILWIMIHRKHIALPMMSFKKIPQTTYKKIMHIGVMNAGEMLSYNLSQMVIVYLVVRMGTASLTAFTYAQNIARVSFAFALAVGQASQIQTSYYVGKKWIEQILTRVQIYFLVSFAVSVALTCIVFFFRYELLDIFTQDPEVITLTAGLIAGSILVEAGRVFNLVFISALKGAGDIKFPVQLGILSMWGVAVSLTYLLGVQFGFGVLGAWLALAADEWVRGIIMARRWRSKVWTKFNLI
ncbi:MATE family efflux transporter [Aliivibrio fischeri]|uniref:MATE family efflux transporter n=1 Tax=Aliivibrio fischeri TaxID=668 RepID=UPI0007C49880|nr:MATE family efflux transporter [Aliivibrio fischeri]MCE7576414.1 MATE family efflux transporter [Aliivibrio fischeri]MCE7588704.1 MATE family efflux transporter [Aliivibrio fischeri]MUJ19543.1 MATE family efflux transporter [Aliivibrio fischeri]MUK25922.1 MATE family efflux transporter [Aliivibrio fischeri]MUK34113.1 MATE family efflux transporter [Aliivibrio fischeri]